jgi:4'-phosphopantetheinyl transferase
LNTIAPTDPPPDRRTVIDVCHAFTASLRVPEDHVTLLGWLSPEELARRARLRRATDRAEYLLAHAIARYVLCRRLGVGLADLEFRDDEHGRPSLTSERDGDLDFNISHAGGAVSLAVVRNGRVGVDIEDAGRSVSASALRGWMADDEIRALDAMSGARGRRSTIAIWSAREALAKALGYGLSLDRHAIAFAIGSDDVARLTHLDPALGEPSEWHFAQRWLTARHVQSTAARGANACAARWRWHELTATALRPPKERLPGVQPLA